MASPFDPKSLITTETELRNLSITFAQRRVLFTESWLAESGLTAILTYVQGWQAVAEATWIDAGVQPEAVAALRSAGYSDAQLHLVFLHPDSLAANPRVLIYYRRLLSMSNKVFARLFPQLTRREGRAPADLNQAAISELRQLNEALSQVSRRAGLTVEEPIRLVTLSEGAAIDGEWRNQIGRIATFEAFEVCIGSLDGGDIRAATFSREGKSKDVSTLSRAERMKLMDAGWKAELIDVGEYRIRLGPQRVGAETANADITIARLDNREAVSIEATGEVKGSTDPANAQERWRLASGNIETMNRMRFGPAHKRPTTFYVGLCITDAVVEGRNRVPGIRGFLDTATLDAAFSIVKFAEARERARFRAFLRPHVRL